jgi:hypothetical protein
MEALYFFIIILLVLTIGFAIILGESSKVDTMEHWGERRCDFDVLMASFYYKPEGDSRSALQFSSDNFNFCISSKTSDYLKTLFGALFEVLQKQMGAADIMTSVMKTLRVQLNNVFAPFSKMMAKFWNKFKQIGSLASRVFQHLFMAMKKAAATGIASVYVALSIQAALLNTIDVVINIIMIVLYICLALIFIFFLPILPVLVIVILSVVGIEKAMPGRTGDMSVIFCFAEETLISMKGGSVKKIKNIVLGDILAGGQTVESVIELPGSGELYSIDGIYVTGDHRIWDALNKKWVFVKGYNGSSLTTRKTDVKWTLITSDRTIPIKGSQAIHLFADWEELPDTDESSRIWETIARDILNPQLASTDICLPTNAPCFDLNMLVRVYKGGWIPMLLIKRGDWILGDSKWTQVIGICHRSVSGGIGLRGHRYTSGTWIRQTDGTWTHPTESEDTTPWSGMNLLTDSGVFYILLEPSSKKFLVRDFTEVGFDRLPETYARVEVAMTDPDVL